MDYVITSTKSHDSLMQHDYSSYRFYEIKNTRGLCCNWARIASFAYQNISTSRWAFGVRGRWEGGELKVKGDSGGGNGS